MKTFIRGEVVLTAFPFSGGSGVKQRPALVLADTGDSDCILAVITSQVRVGLYDIKLTSWKKAKLLFPSTVRVHKVYTKEKATIIGKLGNLEKSDLKHVQQAIKKLWAL